MTEPVPFVEPRLRFFADLRVEVGVPQEVGRTVHGLRRLIPILGGNAQGDGWQARVMPGGADFQLIVSDTLAELDARYTLEADGGDLIYVQNRAVRSGPPELMACVARWWTRRRSTFAAAPSSRQRLPHCDGSGSACSRAPVRGFPMQ